MSLDFNGYHLACETVCHEPFAKGLGCDEGRPYVEASILHRLRKRLLQGHEAQ